MTQPLYLGGPDPYRLSSNLPRGRVPRGLQMLEDTEPRPRELDFSGPPLVGNAGADQLGLSVPQFAAGPGTPGFGSVPAGWLANAQANVNVEAPPPAAPPPRETAPPAGAVTPEGPDDKALVEQGGWAGASEAIDDLMKDYRTTPLQMISGALGGYSRGLYRAQQDLQDQKIKQAQLKALEAEAAMKQQAYEQSQQRLAATQEWINNIEDPAKRAQYQGLYDMGMGEKLADLIAPKPQDPQKVGEGETLVQDGKVIFQGPPKTATPGDVLAHMDRQARLAFDMAHPPAGPQAPETWHQLSPDEVKLRGYPEGTVLHESSRGDIKTGYAPTSRQGLPQGYETVNPSEPAKQLGVTEKVAAPVKGTPDYVKSTGAMQAGTKYLQQLEDMEKLFDKYGVQVWPGEAKGQMESLAGDLKLSYANAKGQGALQKTDDAVIASIQGSVNSWASYFTPGGADQVRAQIKQAKAAALQDMELLQQQFPWANVMSYRPSSTLPKKEEAAPPAGAASATPASAATAQPPTGAPSAARPDEHLAIFGF